MANPLPADASAVSALRYLALVGPTASGKTAAALAIAERHPVEIISLDSALVYRGMDIGTAKPTAQDLAKVPHHLINIRDPLHAYSAAEFARDTRRLITEITARGKLPLLVGGTLLYYKALTEGLDDLPPANAAIRAALAQEATALGWPAMHAQLATLDPTTAARLNPADSQRIARALEVYRITGQTMSSLYTTKIIANNQVNTGAIALNDTYSSVLIALEPTDRAWLHQRIAQRFDAMLAGGLMEEVGALRARGDLNADLPSMRCVGYRQAWDVLDGTAPAAELRDRGIFATRQLAKRQLTWLRSLPNRGVVPCDGPDPQATVLAWVEAAVNDWAAA